MQLEDRQILWENLNVICPCHNGGTPTALPFACLSPVRAFPRANTGMGNL